MIFSDEVNEYYLIAADEFVNPTIRFTEEFLLKETIQMENNEYVCVRYRKDDNSYLFYFKINGKNCFYRILVLIDEKSVWSCKIVSGNTGFIKIENSHNPRDLDTWLSYFNNAVNSYSGGKIIIPVNENPAYDIDEIIEMTVNMINQKKIDSFRDDAMQNEISLNIERYSFGENDSTIEIDRWNIIDLSKYYMGLNIIQHNV